MSARTSELNRHVAALYEEFRRGRLPESRLVRAAPFRQLAESYVFGNFWRKYKDFIRDKSRNLDAEDLLTVAMMALLAGFKEYDAERGLSLPAYLTLKMYQACRQEVRRNYSRASWEVSAASPVQVVSIDDDAHRAAALGGEAVDPEDELERALLHDAIDSLSAEGRRIVYLHHFEGRSFQEIALLLDPEAPVHPSTVKRRYDRALEALKPVLVALGLGVTE